MRILRLDGLRAVAIFAVLLHHHAVWHGGWIGVDLFFVLSGLLITRILRRTREDPNFWRRFYLRRVTRIVPPALVLIAVIIVVNRPPVSHLLLYLLFLANYAGLSAQRSIPNLGIMWSLAVEEHFYLFFPFAVLAMRRHSLAVLLTALLIAEPIFRWIVTPHAGSYLVVYLLTPFHLDGLLCGALLALALESERRATLIARWSGSGALLTGGILVLLSLLLPKEFDRETNTRLFNTVGYSLLAFFCTSVIAWVLLHPKATFNRILESRVMVFLGSISYGMYLYHQALHTELSKLLHKDGPVILPFTFLSATLASWLSFRYFESPIMTWAHERTKH